MSKISEGDLVACYLTNTSVINQLLMWGIVLEATDTLRDILVLDNLGNKNWYPATRWCLLESPWILEGCTWKVS